MVVPKNLNPRRFMSRLMASDWGDEAGISLSERKELRIGRRSGMNEST